MSDWTIQSKTLLSAVDRAADLFLVADASASNAVKNTTVNLMLDLTSHPVGVDDSQTLTNKTLDTTNTVTLLDSLFTLKDNSDNTKIAVFQLSGITTGTTRTFTLPDNTGTIVTTSSTATLTNKTLTSPTINTPVITNPTLTIDTVSEFSAANGVTIDGLNIKDSALNTNNSVPNNAWNNTGVFGSSWAWTSWVPTFTNVSGGTLNYAKFLQIGKTVFFRIKYTLAGAGVSGAVTFSTPVTMNADYALETPLAGAANFLDSGTQLYQANMIAGSTTTIILRPTDASGTYASMATNTSSTVPMTWAANDQIKAAGVFEAA